jgi:ring-1,2-phenylacetyl-CoA epoxidase subunit PaaE
MSIKNYQLRVKEVIRETPDAVSVHFEQPADGNISYKSGQFLTLILDINGQKVRRAYSLCSSPFEPNPAIGIKAIPNGLVSNHVNQHVKAGDVLEIMEPMGNFLVEPNAANTRHIVLLGGGSGITPLYSIAKTILKYEPNSSVTLLYGNRDENAIIFRSGIEKLTSEYYGRFKVVHVLSHPQTNNWNGAYGMLTKDNIIKLFGENDVKASANTEFYMCGPEPMMNEAKLALTALNIEESKIFKESFTSAAATEAKTAAPATSGKTPVTLIFNGSEHAIEVADNETILEAGIDAGLDLPYSCQSGVCTACRGRKKSGTVTMDETEGLSKKEIEQGYVLVCVGHPTSSDVVIEIP